MMELECFFDCSSPWSYFAFESLLRLQDDIAVRIAWRPFLVGGVFNAVNPTVYNSRDTPVPAKAAYSKKDQQDWARHLGLPIHYRPSVFPVNSVKAMRACVVLQSETDMVLFARAVFRSYWTDDKDISLLSVLSEICLGLKIDPDRLFAAIEHQSVKDALRANTQEAIDRGAFGSPTIFVGGRDMYFGNDRMPLIREAVLRLRAAA